MGNLSTREKVLIYVVILLLLIGIVYVAAIRPLQTAIDSSKADLAQRKQTFDYYEELRASNTNTKKAIEEIETNIKKQEASLLANVDTEVIENYVMQVYENSGSPYLSTIKSEDIPQDDIYLPDGSVASERLTLKRITVEYATTDGFNITEYNKNPEWFTLEEFNEETVTEALSHLGDYEYDSIKIRGLDEFIAGTQEIAGTLPSCVKIHKIQVEDSLIGFMWLRAEIDVFGTDLGSSRLLPANDPSQVSIDWTGRTGVDCSGGMIGIPLVNFNDKNTFYLYQLAGKKVEDFSNRPYCSYFSNAIMTLIMKNYGSLYEDVTNRVPYGFDADFEQLAPGQTGHSASDENADFGGTTNNGGGEAAEG